MYNVLMDHKSAEGIENSLEAILKEMLQPIFKKDNRITTLYMSSGICFCVAVFLLAVVGAVRLFLDQTR